MHWEMSSDVNSDDKTSGKTEPNSKLQKLYSSTLVTPISREFYIIAIGRDPFLL